jgi:hypothetical protein
MGTLIGSVTRFIAATAIATSAMWAAPAIAQDMPPQELPTYARPGANTNAPAEIIHGRIASVNGAFRIVVADDRGFNDDVALGHGTIIYPTGLTLVAGMTVTVHGYNAGNSFAAQEIDTDYQYNGPAPQAVYYGNDYWYPGFAYGYGPAFSLGFLGGFGTSLLVSQPFFFVNHFHGRPIIVIQQPPVGSRPMRQILSTRPGTVTPPGTAQRSLLQERGEPAVTRTAPVMRAAAPPAQSAPRTQSAPTQTRSETSSGRRR